MKFIALSAVGAAAIAMSASPAFAKAHAQPADQAHFGQKVAGDATGQDGKKGVDGQEVSEKAKHKEHPEGDPNRQGPK